VPEGDEASGWLPSVLRTKRTIALLRICVLAVVTVLSLSSAGIQTVAGPAAPVLVFDAFVYALTCLVLSTRGGEASPWGRAVTFAIDVALITAWIVVTGGGRSEFWTLYLIVIAAVALRFGIVETIGAAVGLAVLLLAQLVEQGALWTSKLYRPTMLLVAGFAIGCFRCSARTSDRSGSRWKRSPSRGGVSSAGSARRSSVSGRSIWRGPSSSGSRRTSSGPRSPRSSEC
jgi:hypothetical protein